MRHLALAFATVMFGQPPGPYSGNWTADFNGTVYVRLALNDQAGAPPGGMSIGRSIEVDGQGNVETVTEAAAALTPMLDVRRSGEVLAFSYRSGGDVDKFELRLIDTDTAELTLIVSEGERQQLAADGIPPPKPFRLTKSR